MGAESQGNTQKANKRDGGKDSQADQGSNKKKTFVEQLGFKAPDLKVQMINQTALDESVEDVLDQDANFIKT